MYNVSSVAAGLGHTYSITDAGDVRDLCIYAEES